MATVADYKVVASPFSKARELIEVTYDFAADAGATGALDLFKASEDIIITDFYVKGVTVLDSAADGSSIDVGIVGGDTNALMDGVVEASFAAGAVVYDATNQVKPLKVAKDEVVAMEIMAEALTSGKCTFFFEIQRY